MIALLIVLLGVISQLVDTKDLFKPPIKGKKIGVILIFVLCIILGWDKSCQDEAKSNKQEETIKNLNDTASLLRGKIAELNQQAEDIHNDDKRIQKEHAQEQHEQDSVNTEKMLQQYMLGVKQGVQQNDKSTGYILEELRSTKHKLDSLENAIQPKLTHSFGRDTLQIIAKNDGIYFPTKVRNNGDMAALNVNFEVFYLFLKDKEIWEYHRSIGEMRAGMIGGNETITLGINESTFIPNFSIDTTNGYQFILVTGNFSSDKLKNKEPENFELVYVWNEDQHCFRQAAVPQPIIDAHNSKKG